MDFPKQKRWYNKLKSLFFMFFKLKVTKKIWKLCSLGINFREWAKSIFSRELKFANFGVIREIREIFWTQKFLTLKYILICETQPGGILRVFLKFGQFFTLIYLLWLFLWKKQCVLVILCPPLKDSEHETVD